MPGSGGRGEDAAARHLEAQGYRILARNWRHGRLEIDLVCQYKEYIVFVEVKTRGQNSQEAPTEALDHRKCRCLVQAASHYLSRNDLWESPCRFDLAAVSETPKALEVTLYEDIINAADFG